MKKFLALTKRNLLEVVRDPLSIIFLVALFVAWQVGPYPYYADLPLASGFVAGISGIIAGKLLLGR